MFKLILVGLALFIIGSVALDNVEDTTTKIQNTGDLVTAVVDEGGNVLNEGLDSVQNIGGAGEPTPTTAPPVGSGLG